MDPIKPIPERHALPACTQAVTYAKDQPEYIPLPVLRTPDGRVLSEWLPTDDELAKLKIGVPVTLVLHTFNQPLQPVILTVGGVDLT